jgi:hypothetical protein
MAPGAIELSVGIVPVGGADMLVSPAFGGVPGAMLSDGGDIAWPPGGEFAGAVPVFCAIATVPSERAARNANVFINTPPSVRQKPDW